MRHAARDCAQSTTATSGDDALTTTAYLPSLEMERLVVRSTPACDDETMPILSTRDSVSASQIQSDPSLATVAILSPLGKPAACTVPPGLPPSSRSFFFVCMSHNTTLSAEDENRMVPLLSNAREVTLQRWPRKLARSS